MTVFQNLWLVFCRVWVDPHVTFIFFPFGLENEQCIIKLKARDPWYGIEALFWNSSRYSRNIFIMLFRHPYLWANSKEIPIRKLEMHTHTHREGGGRETKKERYRPAFFSSGNAKPRYHRFISCYTRIHHEVTSLKTAYDNSYFQVQDPLYTIQVTWNNETLS